MFSSILKKKFETLTSRNATFVCDSHVKLVILGFLLELLVSILYVDWSQSEQCLFRALFNFFFFFPWVRSFSIVKDNLQCL